jgi:hypothetical protein
VQLVTAAYGLWLDRESLRSLWAVPLQQFVYRQLMYLVIIESFISALKGARSGWRHLPRTGDAVICIEQRSVNVSVATPSATEHAPVVARQALASPGDPGMGSSAGGAAS